MNEETEKAKAEVKETFKAFLPFASAFLIFTFLYLMGVGFFDDKPTKTAWLIGTPIYTIASGVLIWQARRYIKEGK